MNGYKNKYGDWALVVVAADAVGEAFTLQLDALDLQNLNY